MLSVLEHEEVLGISWSGHRVAITFVRAHAGQSTHMMRRHAPICATTPSV